MRLASRSASMPFRRALSACLRQRRAFMPTRSIGCGHGWKPQSAELDLWAAIHHHLQPCRLGPGRRFLVHDAKLHPYRLCADRDRIVHNRADRIRAAKDIDHVDRHPDLRQIAPDIFAVDMLAGDLRIDRQYAVAMVLERLHHAVAGAVRPVGCADEGRSEEHTSELQSLMRSSY